MDHFSGLQIQMAKQKGHWTTFVLVIRLPEAQLMLQDSQCTKQAVHGVDASDFLLYVALHWYCRQVSIDIHGFLLFPFVFF